jgi:hypothetical protein
MSLKQYFHDQLGHGRQGKSTLTVRANGGINIGKVLVKQHGLDQARYALLSYDEELDLIAMKFLSEPEFGSVPISQANGCHQITQKGFAQEFGIEPGEYTFQRKQGNELFLFTRQTEEPEARMTQLWLVVEFPAEQKQEEICEALELVGGKIV